MNGKNFCTYRSKYILGHFLSTKISRFFFNLLNTHKPIKVQYGVSLIFISYIDIIANLNISICTFLWSKNVSFIKCIFSETFWL